MKLLLITVFVLLLTSAGHSAENLPGFEAVLNAATLTVSQDTNHKGTHESIAIESWLSENPYHPSSATHFEVLVSQYLFVQGEEGIMLYDSFFPSRFDVTHQDPYSSLTNRYVPSFSSTRIVH